MLLIKNGKIFTMNKKDEILENTDILVENGKIIKIGKHIEENCEILDASGKNVFPGFVEAHCHLGMAESGVGNFFRDHNENLKPITPECRVIDGMYPQDIAVKEAIEKGVTTATICPGSANIIGGMCSTIKLYGNRIDDMIIKEDTAMKCAFGENPKNWHGQKGRPPFTKMGIASMFRQELYNTLEYRRKKNEGKIGINIGYEAMLKVINREVPVKVHVHRADDIFTAIRIAKEFNLKMTLDHVTGGSEIVDQIAKEGYPAIVGPSFGHRTKVEVKEKSFKTVKTFHDAGIKIAITTDSPVTPLEYLPLCCGLSVAAGMDAYEALKCITINPAEITGVDNRVGSIELGKDADFVIAKYDPMTYIDFGVEKTIIDGKIVFEG